MGFLNRPGVIFLTVSNQILITIVLLKLLGSMMFLDRLAAGLGLILFTTVSFIIYSDFCRSSNQDWCSIFKTFRLMRHDFQNHLQVIFSMIQLKKYDRALNYINEIKRADDTISRICSLSNSHLICHLLELVCFLRQKGIDVSVEISEGFNCKAACMKYLKREAEKMIEKFDKSEGKKDLKITLKDSELELYSAVLGKKVNIKPMHKVF